MPAVSDLTSNDKQELLTAQTWNNKGNSDIRELQWELKIQVRYQCELK